MKVIGLAGWSGAGKTTLLAKLIPALVAKGMRISTIKHAHHEFDVDQPGKDSFLHRASGASEVLVSSSRRWVLMHELNGASEAGLVSLLARLAACDLVIVEGFKREPHPKLEVFRAGNRRPPLHPSDRHIVVIATDTPFPDARAPTVALDDLEAIRDAVFRHAAPLAEVLARLQSHGPA